MNRVLIIVGVSLMVFFKNNKPPPSSPPGGNYVKNSVNEMKLKEFRLENY